MIVLKAEEDIEKLDSGNRIIGKFPILKDSEICFKGNNNILFCEPGITLQGSTLKFEADNSVCYLKRNRYVYRLAVTLHSNNVFYMGKDAYINGKMTVVLSEHKHCFIGDDCMVSYGVIVRNADPHLIYDCESKRRKNKTKSVYIGDHVWIGQNSLILKGTCIDSGSIIGANAVVAGKIISNNCAWGGNPSRLLAKKIFWDGDCVHSWRNEDTHISENYQNYICARNKSIRADRWIYDYKESEEIPFSLIDITLDKLSTSTERCDYLSSLSENIKCRFVHVNNAKKLDM